MNGIVRDINAGITRSAYVEYMAETLDEAEFALWLLTLPCEAEGRTWAL